VEVPVRKIRVKRTTDRHYLPHNDLQRAAQHFRARIDERLAADDRKGIAFDILAELVFLAFSVEAKVNFLGAKLISDWKECAPFNEKLDLVLDRLGIVPDRTVRPYSTLEALKSLRDSMAHGKPVHEVKTEELVIDTDEDEDLFADLRGDWDGYYRGTFYQDAQDDVTAMWEAWIAASKLTHFEATTRSLRAR